MGHASLAEAMIATAANAVVIARQDLGMSVELDFSEASVALLEDVPAWEHGDDAAYGVLAEVAFASYLFQGDDPLDTAAEIFGGYVGEVFRRRHGGEWFWPDALPETRPALRVGRNGLFFVDKVYKRLRELDDGDGPGEQDVWAYYQVMRELFGR